MVAEPGAGEVVLTGSIHAAVPRLSYAQAVADYKAEYRRRYDRFLRTGVAV